ncbi:MAG: hypothetical protein NVSMB47_06100 [Polyangiales bacterium]
MLAIGARRLACTTLGAGLVVAVGLATKAARAAPIEPLVSLGFQAPSNSPYRDAAQQLGYGTGYPRLGFEAEVGALVPIAFDRALSIGPVARLHVERQRSAYAGLDALATDAAFLGLRQELVVYRWPHFFLWLDESLGVGRIGAGDAHKTLLTAALSGGFGARLGEQPAALRPRRAVQSTRSTPSSANRIPPKPYLPATSVTEESVGAHA